MNGFSLLDVADYRLDPPEPHTDLCQCDDCDQWHNDEGRDQWRLECQRCRDVVEWDIKRGVRCQHGRYLPGLTPDGFITNAECPDCQIDSGPAFGWAQRMEVSHAA